MCMQRILLLASKYIFCECNKPGEIDEYLENFTCMKVLWHDLVITLDEIIDTPETESICFIGKKHIKLIILFFSLKFIGILIVMNNRCYLVLLYKSFVYAKIHITILTYKIISNTKITFTCNYF